MLVHRFENDRCLITVYLRLLFELPSLTCNGLRILRDQVNSAIQALRILDRVVEHWDDMLVFLVAEKLDTTTRLAWELELGNAREYPRYSEVDQFRKKSSCFAYCVNHLTCPLCETNHLYQCSTFLKQIHPNASILLKNRNAA